MFELCGAGGALLQPPKSSSPVTLGDVGLAGVTELPHPPKSSLVDTVAAAGFEGWGVLELAQASFEPQGSAPNPDEKAGAAGCAFGCIVGCGFGADRLKAELIGGDTGVGALDGTGGDVGMPRSKRSPIPPLGFGAGLVAAAAGDVEENRSFMLLKFELWLVCC